MNHQKLSEAFSLNGKNALITGGGIGIGRSIALRLAEAGATVTLTDVNLDIAQQTAADIEKNGGKAQAICANADSTEDASKAVQATVQVFGSIDILVNNAAIYPPSQLVDMTQDTWDKVLNTNLRGTFTTSQAVTKQVIS